MLVISLYIAIFVCLFAYIGRFFFYGKDVGFYIFLSISLLWLNTVLRISLGSSYAYSNLSFFYRSKNDSKNIEVNAKKSSEYITYALNSIGKNANTLEAIINKILYYNNFPDEYRKN